VTATAPFLLLLVRDQCIAGLAGALLLLILKGEGAAYGFLAACLWLALNSILLGWFIGALTAPNSPNKLLVFILACAKIPAAYLLLLWLFSLSYLEPFGLAAGLTTLPLVLLFRGLASRRAA
jgi:hypothetical protein